ncbi:asparagine synthase (glutamine-hydrolyzing) [Endozoicomonas sp. SESOKO1]|uniref:asparagine synthase (glutamine-hydrolyzing) n=1 Tax=Endozoicomonas sp. SESOKO1 TaxID=2828742 RepID=UPI0021485CB2|nr:asparagine synthase (glutamine-hydrolyzing) [Endozoicomonas sp. SESOKO1]
MCGLNGFFSLKTDLLELLKIQDMNSAIRHRGPDAGDFWLDKEIGFALGHQRLAIQDLSPAGAQPMRSHCDRYVLVFNGEIYNHLTLRTELQRDGYSNDWRGHSDTETLLAGFTQWGIEKTLKAAVGMFAIALWDQNNKVLTLARDRMGEKPLYWGWQGNRLFFGSELKGLKAHSSFQAEVDRNALALLLRHNCIPAPYCIYQGIEKLRAGHWLQLPLSDLKKAKTAVSSPYWSFNKIVEQGLASPFEGSEHDAINTLENALMSSIKEQMLADVPFGAFLSGGIDSSTVVSLMQAQTNRPVKTFTIGFDDTGYDEATHAKAVARHLGSDHTELYIQPQDALAVIPKLPSIYCEPFSDSSQIPTFLVSELTSQHVTVALSGDGGDELFGGYNRYLTGRGVWEKSRRLPRAIRKLSVNGLRALSPNQWDTLFNRLQPVLPDKLRLRTPGDKAHKLAGVLGLNSEQDFYQQLTSHWQKPDEVVIGGREPGTLVTDKGSWPSAKNFEELMMAMDAQTYMSDDILVKVDRAAMSNSLETRVPFLDHRIAELAWRMPLNFKIRQGEGKWLLKQVLFRHVPQSLIERPKMGFAIPLQDWLRGPLREWAESLLGENRLREEGFFRPEPIRTMWVEHLNGSRNHQHCLWDVLMFQAWLEQQ